MDKARSIEITERNMDSFEGNMALLAQSNVWFTVNQMAFFTPKVRDVVKKETKTLDGNIGDKIQVIADCTKVGPMQPG